MKKCLALSATLMVLSALIMQPLAHADGFFVSGGAGGGSGTEYTEGATDSSITGGAILWEDSGDTLRAVSASKPLPVGDGGGSLTIDASSLPLPSGAATAAKQPALGTAGSASSDVITIQGITSMTAVKVDGSAVTQPVSGTVTVGNATGGSAVNIQDGGNSITVDGSVSITGSLPSGTNGIGKLTANSGVDIGDVDVTSIVPGTGTTNAGKAEDAAHSSGDTGAMSLGVYKTSPTNLSAGPTDGDYEPIQLNAEGGVRVANSASATAGGDAFRSASFTEVNAKASAGTLYALVMTETSGNVRYVQIYNTSGTPVNGSSTVIFSLPLAGFDNKFFEFGPTGLYLGTGISFGCTTDLAGTTDATAGHCVVNAVYK